MTSEFKIKHLTIQLETECCHPEAVHCDLSKLHDQHSHPGVSAQPPLGGWSESSEF
jgi:hypothetical protein